jgi:phosphate-selective porin
MKVLYKLGIFAAALLVVSAVNSVRAEDELGVKLENLQGKVDGMSESQLEMQTTLSALAKIKVSGYIQSQFQVVESDGAAGYSGGNFPTGVHQRFQVRRGRLKVNYVNGLSQYVVQFDVSQNGLGIKDAYLSITEPWMRKWTLTSGVFDRPFGFEISYSSSLRESPERSRMYQVLFPNERDLGMKIEYAPESGMLSFLRAKVGVFNGLGIPGSNSALNENDNNKDIIGRIGVVLPMLEQNMELDGGVSFYSGKIRNQSKYLYTIDGSPSKWVIDSTSTNLLKYEDRSYFGVDAQYYADLPVIGGFSLRGEFISGKQPAAKGSNGFYNPTAPAAGTTPAFDWAAVYNRNVSGYYFNYVQNVGLLDQFVLKYDSFDPNTDVEGSDIGKSGSNLVSADIAYTTLGLGWIHYLNDNVKAVLYYDMVTNEDVDAAATGSLANFKEDVKDNVLTFRLQYKF